VVTGGSKGMGLAIAQTLAAEGASVAVMARGQAALDAAVESLHRALRPGGVCLVTVPVISRLDISAPYKEYWRLTDESARRLFERRFTPGTLDVAMRGNLRAALLFLLGVASDEVSPVQLRGDLPAFPLILTVRAVKHA